MRNGILITYIVLLFFCVYIFKCPFIQTLSSQLFAQEDINRERSGSVVECLTRDLGAAGSSLTSVTVLYP